MPNRSEEFDTQIKASGFLYMHMAKLSNPARELILWRDVSNFISNL